MISPYSAADWQREWEDGHPLPCPQCGSSEDFGPRQGVRPDRSFRPYRACRRCGFAQEADGHSPPYQTVVLAHDCDGKVAIGSRCRGCGLRLRAAGPHVCVRIVRAGDGLTCPECGAVLDERHRRPWPEPEPRA